MSSCLVTCWIFKAAIQLLKLHILKVFKVHTMPGFGDFWDHFLYFLLPQVLLHWKVTSLFTRVTWLCLCSLNLKGLTNTLGKSLPLLLFFFFFAFLCPALPLWLNLSSTTLKIKLFLTTSALKNAYNTYGLIMYLPLSS